MKIDGLELPNPSTYDVTYADLDSDNSYTSETGILNRDMIRSNHATIAVSWDKLDLEKTRLILKAISGESGLKPSFNLEYFDLTTLTYKTGQFYANNRQTKIKKLLSTTNGWLSLSVNFTEF